MIALFNKLTLVVGAICCCPALWALQVGEPATELESEDWLAGSKTSVLWNASKEKSSGTEPLRVVTFFGTYLPLSEQMMPLLNAVQRQYREQGLSVIAMSPEPPETLKRFLERFDVNFNVAVDREGKSTATYAGQRPVLPKSFVIGKENQILWLGDPDELPEVLESIYAGTYNIEISKKVAPILDELETALRSGRAAEIEKITETIFEIDPANSAALRARQYLYESSNRPEKAWDFLDGARREHPEIRKFYYMQLELASRYPVFFEHAPKLVKAYLEHFPNTPGETASIAWMLLTKNDFSGELLSAASIAVKALDAMTVPPERLAACEAAKALFAYRIGKLDDAIAFQAKAVAAASTESELGVMESFATYYRRAQAIAQGK